MPYCGAGQRDRSRGEHPITSQFPDATGVLPRTGLTDTNVKGLRVILVR